MTKNNRHIEAIFWLTGKMAMNKDYHLSGQQLDIIKDIFVVSGIQLPTEPNDAYDYYFDISEDWSTIRKISK